MSPMSWLTLDTCYLTDMLEVLVDQVVQKSVYCVSVCLERGISELKSVLDSFRSHFFMLTLGGL